LNDEYVITPGDNISVFVWGHKEYTQNIPVRPDGKISYPFLGEFRVDGLTTTELSEKIRGELMKHLVNPQVTVVITQPKKNELYVLGQVKFPNQFRFDGDKLSILKALSMAGGILDDVADTHNIKIIRDNSDAQLVDLEKLLESEKHKDIFLYSGDLVYIPKKDLVNVTGYVLNPNQYKTQSSLNITQALAQAGGPMHDTADISKAIIVRSSGEVVKLDIDGALWDKYRENDKYALQPGDTLYIPNAYQIKKVTVAGCVSNPGQYQVKESLNAFQALALAGGITSPRDADLAKARIIREDGSLEYIDLSAMKRSNIGDLGKIKYIMINPGDTLEVPEKRKLINWSLALTVANVVSLLYNMVYTIMR
jgi:polysaccharide export outer membrane protein